MAIIDFNISPTCRARMDGYSDELTVEHHEDVEPYLDRNKAQQNEPVNRRSDFRMAASVPMTVYLKILHETGIDIMNRDHWPAVRRMLNDPDNKYLKTISGRI